MHVHVHVLVAVPAEKDRAVQTEHIGGAPGGRVRIGRPVDQADATDGLTSVDMRDAPSRTATSTSTCTCTGT
ncbi:MAG: hypothetical protein QM831_24750 [Kofleriaceae bacterium]